MRCRILTSGPLCLVALTQAHRRPAGRCNPNSDVLNTRVHECGKKSIQPPPPPSAGTYERKELDSHGECESRVTTSNFSGKTSEQ